MDQELIDADTTVGDLGPDRSVPLGYVEVATSVTAHSRHTLHSSPPGNGDSSVVQRWTRDRNVAGSSPGRCAGEFSSPESSFCADSYFGIRSTPV